MSHVNTIRADGRERAAEPRRGYSVQLPLVRRSHMPRLKPWPVLVGALVDLFGTLVVVLFYLSIVLRAQFSGGDLIEDVLTPTQLAVGDGLGLLLSVVGGFVASRLAKVDEVHHGAAAGFASLMLSLLIGWGSPVEGAASWRDVLLPLAVVPAAALGGYIAARLNARTARQSVNDMQR